MSFTKSTFYCARGLLNCSGSPTAASIHTYMSNDEVAEVIQPNYFPSYFGFTPDDIKNGDYVFFVLGNLNGISLIVDASNSQGSGFIVPSTFVMQTPTVQPNNFTGIWPSSQSVSLLFTETGKICQLTFPEIIQTATISSVITLTIPPFRFPGSDITIPTVVVDNGVDFEGKITFTSSGNFIIEPLNSNFSGIGPSGFYGRTFSFNEFV